MAKWRRACVTLMAFAGVGCSRQIAIVRPPPATIACVERPSGMLHFWPGDGNGRDILGGADASLV